MRPEIRAPREDDFTSHLRSPAVAARVGTALGICFVLAFVTGLVSHWAQVPNPPIPVPTSPSWGYRVTQGVHIASGTAAIPLLLIKLWAVFPKLFAAIPRRRRELVLTALERGSIAVLVASALFMLASGLANAAQWYPWSFDFRSSHYAVAWLAIGALLVHIAVKLPIIRRALGSDIESTTDDRPGAQAVGDRQGLSRRDLVRVSWVAAGVAVLASAGATVPALRRVSVFGVRSGNGPQGVPINKSAIAAGVTEIAMSPDYELVVVHGSREMRFDLATLLALPSHDAVLPIACVEGWSANGRWTGVPVRAILDLVGAPVGVAVRVTSLQPGGGYRTSELPASYAGHHDTLLATHLEGERLTLDHGYPCRIIAPNRPGVLQTKWVSRLETI